MKKAKLDKTKFSQFGKLVLNPRRRWDFHVTYLTDKDGEPSGHVALFVVETNAIPGIGPEMYEVDFKPVSRKLAKVLMKNGVPTEWLKPY